MAGRIILDDSFSPQAFFAQFWHSPGSSKMKSKLFALAALGGVLVLPQIILPQVAVAQEMGADDTTSLDVERQLVRLPEAEVVEDGEQEEVSALSWDFRVTNEFHAFDNLDLLPLKEDTPQDILDTDDRQNFGYTSLAAGVSYDVSDNTAFNLGAAVSGMWGNDQIGSSTGFGGFAYIYDLSVDWTAFQNDDIAVWTTLGRQAYSIGGAKEDYFFKDIIDGVTLNADFGMAGRLRLMFDVYGDSGRPDDVYFLNYINAHKQTTNNFRGDTDIYRFGGVYELLDIVKGVDLRAFGYGAAIGALRTSSNSQTTGADISTQGVLGNFADQDYTMLFGARANYTYESDTLVAGVMGEYARSMGIDRKARRLGLYDLDTEGNAFGVGAHAGVDLGMLGVEGRFRFFHADGGNHSKAEGLPFSHGFVGMKGSQIGGINMNRYAGWRPSAYVSNSSGIQDNPQDITRGAGTMSAHGGLGFLLGESVRLDVDGWYFQDTSETNFDVTRAREVGQDIAFGYSQAELEAQERLGKSLGTEFNLTLTVSPTDLLSLYAVGGVFMPGEFYETRINRNVGTSLGAPGGNADMLENFWVASAGATLAF